MKKSIIALGLSILASGAVYGQDVVGVQTAPSADQPWNQPLPWEKFSLKPNDFEPKELTKPSFPFQNVRPLDRIDPFMPILVPPKDLVSRFPIKAFPQDFPSSMPIAKLKDLENFLPRLPNENF